MHIRRPVTDQFCLEVLEERIKDLKEIVRSPKRFVVKKMSDFFDNLDYFVYLVSDQKDNYTFLVFNEEDLDCICCVEFFIADKGVQKIFKLTKYKKVFLPHCTVHPRFRNQGLVSGIYEFFLTKYPDAVLYTNKHTKSAKSLWEKVAKKINGNIVYHNIVTGLEEDRPTRYNFKILTK